MESEDISFSDIVPHDDSNDIDQVDQRVDDQVNGDEFIEEAGENKAMTGNSTDIDMILSPQKRTRRLKSEVKRCVSKWILFSAEERPRVVEEFPDYTFPEIARTIAERYRNISAHDTERLDEIVRLDKERYKMELAEADDDLPGDQMSGNDLSALPISTLAFPMSKVRKACKLDPEVKAISKDAVPLITKAVELFVGFLARKVAYTVSLRGVRSIREADLIQTIYMHESLEFMRIDFPRKPMNSLSKTPSMRHEVVPKHRVNVSQKTLESTVGVKAKADRLNAQVAPAGKSIAHFFGGSGVTSSAPATEAPPVDVVQSIGTVVVEEEKDRVAVAEGATAKEQSDAHSEVVLDEVVAEAAAESSMADVDVGQNDGARSELEA